MESVLTQLNLYCSDILGVKNRTIKNKKKKEGNSNKSEELVSDMILKNEDVVNPLIEEKVCVNSKFASNTTTALAAKEGQISNKCCPDFAVENVLFTEDGFKITDSILPDDSDISDAFISDSDEAFASDDNDKTIRSEALTNTQVTDDGFKIVSDIPLDDSDISDAFESDVDEEQWVSEVQKRKLKCKVDNAHSEGKESVTENVLSNYIRREKICSLKKPLLGLIYDFGMEDKIFPTGKMNIEKSDQKLSQNIKIFDYSKKRGKRKIDKCPNSLSDKIEENKTQEAHQKEQFKKARYDVFKFGINGFEKEEKQNLKIALAVKLGAKPPKNIAKNYKTIIEERKAAKKMERDRSEFKDEHSGFIKNKEKNVAMKKKDAAPVLGMTTGKFKGGVLKLSKNDIKKIQSSR